MNANPGFLRAILDATDALFVILDANGHIVFFNRACERLFGYNAEQVRARLKTGLLPLPREMGAIKELLANFRSGRNSDRYENQWETSDGRLRTISWSITLILSEQQTVQYIFATGADITSLKHTEQLLQREQALLQGLINSIPDLIFYKDRASAYLGCNTAFEAYRKCKASEIVGKTDDNFYPPDLAKGFTESDRQVIGSSQPVLYENWTLDPGQQPILLETRKTPYFGPDGELLGVIGIARDITQHRQVEFAMREAVAEIELLISSLSSILIVLSPALCVRRWNPTAHETLGLPAEEAIGRPLKELGISWKWEIIAEQLERCAAELRSLYLDPIPFTRKDGLEGYLGINISPIQGEDNQLSGFILLGRDITDRRIMESRMVQAQKLESIGQLAAGIAHEINTPIQYVGDNIAFLQDTFRDLTYLLGEYQGFIHTARQQGILLDEVAALEQAAVRADLDYLCSEIPPAIEQSLEGIRRVSEIVKSMKDFSHPGLKEKTYLDINGAIQNTLIVTCNQWKYVAAVETDLDSSLPKVLCQPGQISQVFLNLLINAVDAVVEKQSAEKGKITIRTRQSEGWVEVSVLDTGAGIPEAVQPRIFEPFYTTKEVGKGTGQGLAIAYDVIVRKHGGTITVKSRVGEGTTFTIRLPVEPPPGKDETANTQPALGQQPGVYA